MAMNQENVTPAVLSLEQSPPDLKKAASCVDGLMLRPSLTLPDTKSLQWTTQMARRGPKVSSEKLPWLPSV